MDHTPRITRFIKGYLSSYRQRVEDWHKDKFGSEPTSFPLMSPVETLVLISETFCVLYYYLNDVDTISIEKADLERIADAPSSRTLELLHQAAPKAGYERAPDRYPLEPLPFYLIDEDGKRAGVAAADYDAAVSSDSLIQTVLDRLTDRNQRRTQSKSASASSEHNRYSEVVMFTGAGASRPCGIPTMKEFVDKFKLMCEQDVSPQQQDLLRRLLSGSENLEHLLTLLDYLSRISNERTSSVESWLCHEFAGSLDKIQAFKPNISSADVQTALNQVHSYVDQERAWSTETLPDASRRLHRRLIRFIHETCAQLDVKGTLSTYGAFLPLIEELSPSGVDWFTTNYDATVETFLINRPEMSLHTGFEPGGYWADHWDTMADTFAVRYYKLHGSVTWYRHPETNKVLEVEGGYEGETYTKFGIVMQSSMLYPVTSKMEYLDPYFSLVWHFKQCLMHSARLLVVVGYGLADGLILDMILNALVSNPRLHIVLVNPAADFLWKGLVQDRRVRGAESRFIRVPTPLEDPKTMQAIRNIWTEVS